MSLRKRKLSSVEEGEEVSQEDSDVNGADGGGKLPAAEHGTRPQRQRRLTEKGREYEQSIKDGEDADISQSNETGEVGDDDIFEDERGDDGSKITKAKQRRTQMDAVLASLLQVTDCKQSVTFS